IMYLHPRSPLFSLLFFQCTSTHRDLLSFPTRRSSDLADVDKNQIYNRPQLDLYMSYQDASQSGGLPLLVMPDRSRQTVIGLQLNVPLFAGGSYDSKLRQAIDQKRQADAQLQAAMLTSDVQIREQFQAVEVAVPQIEALEKA